MTLHSHWLSIKLTIQLCTITLWHTVIRLAKMLRLVIDQSRTGMVIIRPWNSRCANAALPKATTVVIATSILNRIWLLWHTQKSASCTLSLAYRNVYEWTISFYAKINELNNALIPDERRETYPKSSTHTPPCNTLRKQTTRRVHLEC